MDEKESNVRRMESTREMFYEALVIADWDECRALLKDLEEMSANTYEMLRDLETAISDENATDEPDDFTNSKGLDV